MVVIKDEILFRDLMALENHGDDWIRRMETNVRMGKCLRLKISYR